MATDINKTTPCTSFTVDNNCFKKKKYTFVCLSSDKINKEVAIGHKSVPVLKPAAVIQITSSSTTNIFTASRNTTHNN